MALFTSPEAGNNRLIKHQQTEQTHRKPKKEKREEEYLTTFCVGVRRLSNS